MYRSIALFFAVVALAVCAGKTYTITLLGPATVGSTDLKAGEHRVTMLDQNTVVIDGKADSKTTVKVETAKDKYDRTSIRVNTGDGKSRVQEIRLGGTATKLVIADPGANAGN
jgi:hypothetical protein